MKPDTELARMAWGHVEDCDLGILVTADAAGQPHATWMNFRTKGYLGEIFTITAPNTQKVANLRANPHTEWMFWHPGFHAESIVYVTGETRIIEGEAVRAWWDAMPGKAHAFFRRYNDTDDPLKFVALVTSVTNVTCSCPAIYRKTTVVGPGA